jgi:hypothetical protein
MRMFPYKIYTRKKIFNYYTGLSFFVFIWISRLTKDEVRLVRHEKIHFLQQLEMLFFLHWFLYGVFYLVARAKGHCHWVAYRYNPFEIEAYDNEYNPEYLSERKAFAWMSSFGKYQQALSQDLSNTVPKEKLIKW